ncbi:MAG: 30S ribosomal protein S17 [Candidatus Colwellbacteria bacterium]|nr:30S ribosomal protein S17 [Candidatus Colwellbacteria bacterium]MBI3273982.1 30S ribosomal protein S17 [Candidatus Colwellbacteria bacterium]
MGKNKEKHYRRENGVVVSDKMDKTVVVEVVRTKIHPKYKKRYNVNSRFKAHDESNKYKVGDKVVMEQTRPLSKDKKWRVVSKI